MLSSWVTSAFSCFVNVSAFLKLETGPVVSLSLVVCIALKSSWDHSQVSCCRFFCSRGDFRSNSVGCLHWKKDVCTPIKHLYDNGYLLVIVEVPVLSWPSLHVLLNMCLNFELLSGWLFQIELHRNLLLSTILACTQIWHNFHCLAYLEQLGFGEVATKSLLWLCQISKNCSFWVVCWLVSFQ